MHVVVTNDDGPPGKASPYIHHFVEALTRETDWKITVVIPQTQKSWVSRAFVIGDTVSMSYYSPGREVGQEGEMYYRSRKEQNSQEWILLDGTPATCTNIALHHICEDPVDLVISGPNYGRNTSAIFALGSGTIGGALEGVLLGVRAIALSFAFFEPRTSPHIVRAACSLAIRIIKHLLRDWRNADFYSINIPLVNQLPNLPIQYTKVLENRWSGCFSRIPDKLLTDADSQEYEIREQDVPHDTEACGGEESPPLIAQKRYRFRPNFSELNKFVERAGVHGGLEDGRMSDGWAVSNGIVSVTPLRANFMHGDQSMSGELKLSSET